jgi:iron(III) transport system permease protein
MGGSERPPSPPGVRHAPGNPGRSSIWARSWWPGPRLVSLLVGGGAAILVLYPIAYLIQASLSVGDPQARPPEAYGLDNFTDLGRYKHIIGNTLQVAAVATVLAVVVGFVMAWILSRTNVPGRAAFEQLMALPYYVTPLMGALAWAIIASPSSGYVNQLWRVLGGEGHLIDINSSWGIAWVMALFEGSVAFVMIGAVMKSMDPSMEEASQVLGAGRIRTMLKITLPLVLPGVLGAAVYVFAEMLGSFSAALVLGLPARFYVVTTAMYQLVSQYPPRFPTAAAMGVSLFAVMFAMVWIYRRIISSGTYVTITGKAFRPRVMDVGSLRWPFLAICIAYLAVAVILPVLTIVYASFQHLGAVAPRWSNFTLANYATALSLDAVRSALWNSLLLGFATASIGVVLMGFLSWLIYRSRLPGAGAIEYLLMFPQAVPRLVFAFGMMWAWLVFPIPIYGTLWLLLIAYLTVFLPLGLRTISGVILQIDRSLEESAQMCGATWGYRLRTVTMPLLKPGLVAAWLLLFIASVRELGASILLIGPKSKVITPAIVESWFSTSTELTAAMALLQTLAVAVALAIMFAVARRAVQAGGE